MKALRLFSNLAILIHRLSVMTNLHSRRVFSTWPWNILCWPRYNPWIWLLQWPWFGPRVYLLLFLSIHWFHVQWVAIQYWYCILICIYKGDLILRFELKIQLRIFCCSIIEKFDTGYYLFHIHKNFHSILLLVLCNLVTNTLHTFIRNVFDLRVFCWSQLSFFYNIYVNDFSFDSKY